MGLPFHFSPGEGPVIEKPVRTKQDIDNLRTDRAAELGYVSEAVSLVAKHFAIAACDRVLRRAVHARQLHDRRRRLAQLCSCQEDDVQLARRVGCADGQAGCRDTLSTRPSRCAPGADVIQIFDSWVGCLSVEDYRRYVLPHDGMVKQLQKTGVPIIYFGTDSATLLPAMKETGADVVGLDWRIPLDEGWQRVGHQPARAGQSRSRAAVCRVEGIEIPRRRIFCAMPPDAAGHIFNLGHGILPETPVENVKNLARFVQELRAAMSRIAIIGGGISGLAAAHSLEEFRRAGEDTRIHSLRIFTALRRSHSYRTRSTDVPWKPAPIPSSPKKRGRWTSAARSASTTN